MRSMSPSVGDIGDPTDELSLSGETSQESVGSLPFDDVLHLRREEYMRLDEEDPIPRWRGERRLSTNDDPPEYLVG